MAEEEYARPATIADLKMVIQSLNENNVDYFLIGGYALFAHGYYRATTDIDILVPPTSEQGKRVIKALLVLPEKAGKHLQEHPSVRRRGQRVLGCARLAAAAGICRLGQIQARYREGDGGLSPVGL